MCQCAPEIARGNAILVIENAAAKDVEQDIGVMVYGDVFLGSRLEAVGGGNDAGESFRAVAD